MVLEWRRREQKDSKRTHKQTNKLTDKQVRATVHRYAIKLYVYACLVILGKFVSDGRHDHALWVGGNLGNFE